MKKTFLIVCACLLTMLGGRAESKSAGGGFTRDDYAGIIDISLTPTGQEKQIGCFTDQGAWMGFTLPGRDKPAGGFCGPFSINGRWWFAKSAVSLMAGGKPLPHERADYVPGKIGLCLKADDGCVEEQLLFVDSRTALLHVTNTGRRQLTFSALEPHRALTVRKEGNHLVLGGLPGETLMLTFPPSAELRVAGNNYTATLPPGLGEADIVVSMLLPGDRQEVQRCYANSLLGNYRACENDNLARWNGYLNKVLRPDMPTDYNRVAVKAVTTLVSNWRCLRGGLLHDGIVPSHAVGYFVGCWAWDCWRFSAAMASFFPELAKDNIRVMFDYQQSDGMVIDCIYVDPRENNARDSKPPLACWAVDRVFEATGDTAFVREMYPKLLHYYRWWYRHRDHNANGICEFGSADGTLEAAAWESGMDNAIRFDGAKMLHNGGAAWSIDQESVDLNAYLAYEYTLLGKFAALLGMAFDEPDLRGKVADYFFDDAEGYFFDRRLADGRFVREPGCEGYLPFWTRIATRAQWLKARRLLEDPRKFATYIPFPTIAADNPKYDANGYWRGPIWLDQTYYAIEAFRNYGEPRKADGYTRRVFDRLQGLSGDAPIYENYDTFTGRPLQASHFSWSAAHLLLLYERYGKK